jgi:hypothetical protein
MKNSLTLSLFSFFAFVGFSQGQTYQSEEEYMIKTYGKEKKEIMGAYLKLSNEEAEKFWPLYEQYEGERSAMAEERWEWLKKYIQEYKTVNDAIADRWLDQVFESKRQYSEHLKENTRRIQANVGAKRALQFYELESYFRVGVRDRIYNELPFVGE